MSKTVPDWRERAPGDFWISHKAVTEADIERLADAERLTVWNVRFPDGSLAALPKLWWLDLRGGSRTDLSLLQGCVGLRGLVVNQVRGLQDATAISSLPRLELLSLYGLARLRALPALASLDDLLGSSWGSSVPSKTGRH
jgi:hypothetical protein